MRLLVGILILVTEALSLLCLAMLAGHWSGFLDGIRDVKVQGAFVFYIPVIPQLGCLIGLAVALSVMTFSSALRRLLV